MGVAELEKPRGIWCTHCDPRKGCRIYGRHPEECRNFLCGYLTNSDLGEIWNPMRCRMVLTLERKDLRRLSVYVDPARAGIWRHQPYHGELKRFARAAAQSRGQVIVWEGRKAIAVLPDRDKELGEVKAGQFIVTTEVMGRGGTTLDAVVLDGNDPRFLAIKARSGQPEE
jgi:hypothetical protein